MKKQNQNLSSHVKSDKFKWFITFVSIILLSVMIVGLSLQLFGQGKMKPSEWFNKSDTSITPPDSSSNDNKDVVDPDGDNTGNKGEDNKPNGDNTGENKPDDNEPTPPPVAPVFENVNIAEQFDTQVFYSDKTLAGSFTAVKIVSHSVFGFKIQLMPEKDSTSGLRSFNGNMESLVGKEFVADCSSKRQVIKIGFVKVDDKYQLVILSLTTEDNDGNAVDEISEPIYLSLYVNE